MLIIFNVVIYIERKHLAPLGRSVPSNEVKEPDSIRVDPQTVVGADQGALRLCS